MSGVPRMWVRGVFDHLVAESIYFPLLLNQQVGMISRVKRMSQYFDRRSSSLCIQQIPLDGLGADRLINPLNPSEI